MKILLAKEFKENFSSLDKQTQKRADKQILIFKNNIFHPSLHTEKLSPKWKEVWSFRIDKRFRVIFRFINQNTILFLTVGPHDWVYRAKF
jgi:mRNA-degrading endonuclease RelE of RelBE toxin-antitoxin system